MSLDDLGDLPSTENDQDAAKVRDVPAGIGGICWHRGNFLGSFHCHQLMHTPGKQKNFALSTTLCHSSII
jgi:hypothetical protein